MAETWTVALNEGAHLQHAIVAGEDGFVSRAQIIAEVEDEEHARLIAAAPKMAELLEAMVRVAATIPWVADEVPEGLAPMFYGTLTAEGDRKVHGQYVEARALLASIQGEQG